MYFLETLQVRAPCHGSVLYSFLILMQCCFNFLWIFLNIEKNISIFFFFQYFKFSSRFHAISNIKKKMWCKKKKKIREGVWIFFFFLENQFFLISRFMLFSTLKKYWKVPLHLLVKWCPFHLLVKWCPFHLLVKWEVVSPNSREKKSGGGGGGVWIFFFRKPILSYFTFYAIFNIKKKNIKYWKVPLHLLVKWEVISPNSREGQLGSISIILYSPCSDFVSQMWGGGNVFLTFYAISNISRKNNLGIQKQWFLI